MSKAESIPESKRICDEMCENSAIRYGPGHVVFDDYNLEDSNIDSCLADIEEQLQTRPIAGENPFITFCDLTAARDALLRLKKIPEAERIAWTEPSASESTHTEKEHRMIYEKRFYVDDKGRTIQSKTPMLPLDAEPAVTVTGSFYSVDVSLIFFADASFQFDMSNGQSITVNTVVDLSPAITPEEAFALFPARFQEAQAKAQSQAQRHMDEQIEAERRRLIMASPISIPKGAPKTRF